jgi:hypothetical protein
MTSLLLAGLLSLAGALGPYTVSGNFAGDLFGPVDTRPGTWGRADSAILPVTFKPPAGYRVRILSIRGDVVSWIKTVPGGPPTPPESAAGVLGAFQTPSASGSAQCDWCADGCLLYVQGAVTEKQPAGRVPFNYVRVDALLDSDNVLNAKMAAWLNNTEKPIHIEITYTIQFRYEKEL